MLQRRNLYVSFGQHWEKEARAAVLVMILATLGPHYSVRAQQPTAFRPAALREVFRVRFSFGRAARGQARARRTKDPRQALRRSLGGTLIPLAVGVPLVAYGNSDVQVAGGMFVVAGAVLGPALGHVYVRNHSQARRGMWLRGIAGSVPFVWFAMKEIVLTVALPFAENESALSPVLLGIAGAVVGGSAAYDIATVPRAARRHGGARIQVRPQVGLRHVGMIARIRF